MLAAFDADGDGALSREEHEAAHEARKRGGRGRPGRPRGGVRRRRRRHAERRAELAALRAALREKIRAAERPF
jgi:hypothetical protein